MDTYNQADTETVSESPWSERKPGLPVAPTVPKTAARGSGHETAAGHGGGYSNHQSIAQTALERGGKAADRGGCAGGRSVGQANRASSWTAPESGVRLAQEASSETAGHEGRELIASCAD